MSVRAEQPLPPAPLPGICSLPHRWLLEEGRRVDEEEELESLSQKKRVRRSQSYLDAP